jgi:hypothetical protein
VHIVGIIGIIVSEEKGKNTCNLVQRHVMVVGGEFDIIYATMKENFDCGLEKFSIKLKVVGTELCEKTVWSKYGNYTPHATSEILYLGED